MLNSTLHKFLKKRMHDLSESDLELLELLGFEVSDGDSDQGYITLKKNNKGAVISKSYDDRTFLYFYGSYAKEVAFKNIKKVDLENYFKTSKSEIVREPWRSNVYQRYMENQSWVNTYEKWAQGKLESIKELERQCKSYKADAEKHRLKNIELLEKKRAELRK